MRGLSGARAGSAPVEETQACRHGEGSAAVIRGLRVLTTSIAQESLGQESPASEA